MPRFSTLTAVMRLLLATLATGCHRPAVMPPLRAQLAWEHCWWAVMRTTLPPDSVAIRYANAFTSVGLTRAQWTRSADTAWAHAGPALLGRGIPGASYESRAVAYWHGDSTHFRYFVAITPPTGRSTLLADTTVGLAGGPIGLCQEIARAASIPSSVPREPTGEETLRVWTRIP